MFTKKCSQNASWKINKVAFQIIIVGFSSDLAAFFPSHSLDPFIPGEDQQYSKEDSRPDACRELESGEETMARECIGLAMWNTE